MDDHVSRVTGIGHRGEALSRILDLNGRSLLRLSCGQRVMKFFWQLIFIFAFVTAAVAQNSILTGTVSDESGAVIPGASIIFRLENGRIYSAKSNSDGEYQLQIPSGLYLVSFERSPFTSYRLADYWVVEKSKMRMDIALRCLHCQIIEDFAGTNEAIETTPSVPSSIISPRPLEKVPEPIEKNGKEKKKKKRKVNS